KDAGVVLPCLIRQRRNFPVLLIKFRLRGFNSLAAFVDFTCQLADGLLAKGLRFSSLRRSADTGERFEVRLGQLRLLLQLLVDLSILLIKRVSNILALVLAGC